MKHKILVVDDSKSIRQYTMDVLNEAGFETLGASDGQSGLRCVEEYKPDVLLLDVLMPGMSGIDVLRSLRQKRMLLPVLLFTSQSDTKDMVAGLNSGADDYIIKPFKNEELVARTKSAVRRVVLEKKLAEARDEAEKNLRKFREAQTEVIQQGRLIGIARLAAYISHEINNPLAFVRSNIKTLESYFRDMLEGINRLEELAGAIIDKPSNAVPVAREALHWISDEETVEIIEDFENLINETIKGTDRMSSTTQVLRTMDKVNFDQQDIVDINEIVRGVIDLVPYAFQHVNLSFNKGRVPEVSCNPAQLKMALLNILDNAMDAVKDGGKVALSTYVEDEWGCIEVLDTGCGIPASHLDHVFDPFFTTKDVGKGTGLGLTISNGILRSYGGSVQIKSSNQAGTTVVLRLSTAVNNRVGN